MKTELISRENNEAKFKMEFSKEEFAEAANKAYLKARKDFQVDGFRKGKAPRGIIEKRYGEGIFLQDAINDLFNDNYPKAINENNIDIIDNPKIELGDISKEKPLVINVTVATSPIVEVKKYKGLSVEQVKDKVKKEEVDSEIESLRKRNARIEKVDREVKDGDTVNFDYSGEVDGEKFEGGTAEKQDLKIGSGAFIPGFEDQILGKKAGDEFDVTVTFPDDYGAENLAGKDAVFHCKLHEVREEQLPDLDDDFASDVSDFDTMKELVKDTEKKLQDNKDESSKNEAKDKLVDQLYKDNSFDIPDVMVEDEITNGVNELDQQLQYQGMSIDMYLKYLGKDMDALRAEMKNDSREKVGKRIILKSIADKEGIEVSDDDLQEELQRLADQYRLDVEKVRENIGESNMGLVKNDIKLKKAMDLVYDNAKVKLVDPPKKDEKKEDKPKKAKKETKKETKKEAKPAKKSSSKAAKKDEEKPEVKEEAPAPKRRGGKGAGTR